MPYYGWFGVSTFECDLSTLLLAVCIGGVRTSVCVCSVYYILSNIWQNGQHESLL